MTSEHGAPDADISRALDRLGADAVAESGPPPPTPRRAGGPRRHPATWLTAAAIVVIGGLGVGLALRHDSASDDQIVADRTEDLDHDGPAPAPAETERADVTVEFRRDPDRRELAFIGTVANHSAQPWSWDCMQGTLSRWDGDAWTVVAPSVIWDDGLLALHENVLAIDCGPPEDFLAAGATEERAMQPIWLDRGSGAGTRPMATPGDYRLVTEGDDGIVAVGRFTIEPRPAADPTTTIAPAATPEQSASPEQTDGPGRTERPDQTDSTECDLLSADELAPHLGGVVTLQPTDADGMLEASCTASSDSTSLVYRHLTADEYHDALQGSNIDPSTYIGERPVDGADDSVIALFPETGRTSAIVMGMVLVGDEALVFDLRGGDAATLSAAGLELAPVLAHRLREHHG